MTQPGPFLFKAETEQELQDAIDNGLTETHYLDFKRELGLTEKAKKDFATDVAALAVDGGVLIIGVDEEDTTVLPKLTPVDLTGLAERVVQIAGMRPDPGIAVRTFSVPSARGNNTGYLFVQVRPSPQAPHQVDGRYYGRADKTNRILSNAENERLISQRINQQRDTVADAHAALTSLLHSIPEGITGAPPMMLLLAEPLGVRQDDPLVVLTESDSMQQDVLNLLRGAIVAEHQQFAPSLKDVARVVRRANAVAATTDFRDDDPFPGNERTVELRLHESGRIVLASRRPVVFPNGDDQPQVFEVLTVGHADLLVRLTALVSDKYAFAGSWRFGLVVTGVRGATSYALSEAPFYETGPRFTDALYQRATSASLQELEQTPQQVVRRLVSGLLRSVGSHELPRWAWLST